MNIVVLDGYTLNPGDLSWAELEKLGNCRVYDRTEPADIVARAGQAEVVLTNKTILNAAILDQLPRLKYIGVLATGYNVVDIAAARKRSIPVTNIPTYGTRSVAQMVFALLLELAHHVGDHSRSVREGKWSKGVDFCYWDYPLIELEGLTMGIVGLGRIGAAVANLAAAFGMKVIAHTQPPVPPGNTVELVDLPTLFSRSDVVSLHCPLTDKNAGFINASNLRLMKPGAFLINTSRGGLVDQQALADALNNGLIAGAGLDVLAAEPPPADNPLLKARNCIITPHVAWATGAARKRLLDTAVDNVREFLSGRLKNAVN